MKKFFPLIVFLLALHPVKADSFLTSTYFYKAYQSKAILKKAMKSGQLNNKLIKFILKKRKPVAVKLAIINQFGWDFSSKPKNSSIFLEYVFTKGLYKDLEDLKKNADEEVLICFAYMLAMEDYFDVEDALGIANTAVSKDNRNEKASYSINLVRALLSAQVQQHKSRWCRAFKECDKVRMNSKLKLDMKEEARESVFEYVELYREFCD